MSESAIEIVETGAARAAAHLEATGARAADILPLKPALDEVFAGAERARFGLSGPGWAALDERTSAIKAANGLDPRILRATGALYESLVRAGSGDEEHAPDRLSFGTDVEYARFHQFGTRYMPKRKAVDLSETARAEIAHAIETYVVHGLP